MFEVDFIPVGEAGRHGQAIALRFTRPDTNTLAHVVIDAGFQASGEAVVKHFDDWYGTRVVDLAILTHPDGDHIGGMGHVIRELDVENLWLHHLGQRGGAELAAAAEVDDLIGVAQERGTQVFEAFAGATALGGALRVVGPSEEWYEELVVAQVEEERAGVRRGRVRGVVKGLVRRFQELLPDEIAFGDAGGTNPRNNSAMMTLIEVEGKRLFFPSDGGVPALERAWDEVVAVSGDGRPPDFVEVPHHGSRKNGSTAIFNRILGPVGQGQAKSAYVNVAPEAVKHPSPRIANGFMRRGYKLGETKGQAITYKSSDVPMRDGWVALVPLSPFDESQEED